MVDYSNMTQEQFDTVLFSILQELNGSQLIDIPGIYEIVSEHFNNEVLDIITAQEQEYYDQNR